jgi:hypothetical protein
MLGTTSIKGLEELIVKEMREGSLPDLVPFTKEIKDMIENMLKPDLVSQINSGQSSLNSWGAVFDACNSPAATPSNASSLSQDHRVCRQEELQKYTVYTEACSKALIYVDDYIKNCSDFNKINSLPILASDQNLPTNCQKTGNISNVDLFNGLARDFKHLLDTYVEKQDSCNYWRDKSSQENATCEQATSEYSVVNQKCNDIQHRMDDAYCQAYVESTSYCTNQATCYEDARHRFVETNTTVAALQYELFIEYQGLMRIMCLLDGLENTTELKQRIAICENQVYDNSLMTINYPYFDKKAPFLPSAPNCTNPTKSQPGTQAYIQEQYSTLARPATTCTSDCCVMCQYYSCAAPLTPKANISFLMGYTDDLCCK